MTGEQTTCRLLRPADLKAHVRRIYSQAAGMARVLRPGGRFAGAEIVSEGEGGTGACTLQDWFR